ncbi:MAG: peptidoglycan DD-metalloendopeptidase family protein [Bacillota bacterium]|nr:peptidoglycan DD-metalloendopeptidase family protein [Bacillota bacterium]
MEERKLKRLFLIIIQFIYHIGDFVRTSFELLFEEILHILHKSYDFTSKTSLPYIRKVKPVFFSLLLKVNSFRKRFSAFAFKVMTGHEITQFTFPLTNDEKSKIKKYIIAHAVYYTAPVIASVVFFTLITSAKDYTMGLKVLIDNKEVAAVKDQNQYQEVLRKVENYVSSVSGETYKCDVQPVFQVSLTNKEQFKNESNLENTLLSKASDIITDAYGLYVDGQLIAANNDEKVLNDQLQAVVEQYKNKDAVEENIEFIQDVKVEKSTVPVKMIKTANEISGILNSQVVRAQTYTVKKGDMLLSIAKQVGMTVNDLQALNPNVNPNVMREGTELKVSKSVPLLSVKIVRKLQHDESIPYTVEKKKTNELYTSQSKVSVSGQEGTARVTEELFIVDGVEVTRQRLSREVISNPVNQVELWGSKELPKKTATGSLRYPVGGYVSSRFGVSRGASFHTGLDLACSRGTPIAAADGGTVVFAGRSGGYGLLVKISHGNGYETYYAHCSVLLVQEGQKVAKGEIIAKVGTTGNSTGPHLHFEVRVNGQPQNPLNYLN